MDSYVFSLVRLGFSPERATEKCNSIARDFGMDVLDEYVQRLEADLYVDIMEP